MDLSERLIAPGASWAEMRAGFRWPAPEAYNIAQEACFRWAKAAPGRQALSYIRPDGVLEHFSYARLAADVARTANLFQAMGLSRGDRVAILLPQRPETIFAHLAAYAAGAIAVPLFTLFGEDGLRFRLRHSGCKMVITDGANLHKINAIAEDLPELSHVFSVDGPGPGAQDFHAGLAAAKDRITLARTALDTPALISYTSGTTGPPKGALHAHRVLLGHLPGVMLPHNFLPKEGDKLWTPADWAWMGGLMNVMLPALALGVPLLAHRMAKFDPEEAFSLIRSQGVRNSFLPPTALKLMRQAPLPGPLGLRSVASGGEALGAALLAWGEEAFGLKINEFYGQTECNLIVTNAAEIAPPKPGSMGQPTPGADLAVIDTAGAPLRPGEVGEIAVAKGHPAMFLEYWKAPEKTEAKFTGHWMRTGDVGQMDSEGFIFFSSRDDDVITSSGYRIGPTEIEDCLTSHPAVTLAAVIGVPDPLRTEAVKAYIVPSEPGHAELGEALIAHVRTRLSPHLAPREVVFVDSLPTTATGKIMRRQLKLDHEAGNE